MLRASRCTHPFFDNARRRAGSASFGASTPRFPPPFGLQVTSFSLSAEEIRALVLEAFPDARINFEVDEKRQAIIDTWPADLDDTAARRDWGWEPVFDLDRSFNEYLIPNIEKQYQG